MLLKYHTADMGYLVFPDRETFAAKVCWECIIHGDFSKFAVHVIISVYRSTNNYKTLGIL